MIYDTDLAYIHDAGFSASAERFAASLQRMLHEAGWEQGRIVELGCGSGVTARQLLEAGYEVVGVDLSPAMVELARQRAPAATFQAASLWDYEIPTCQCVVALNEVLCYRAGVDDRPSLQPFFRRVHDALAPGGLFVFDVAEIGLCRDESCRFHETPQWSCFVRYEYDHQHDRLTRHITTFRQVEEQPEPRYRRSHERHLVQLFQEQEVLAALQAAGFAAQSVRHFGESPILPQRVGFIARKPPG